MPFSNYHAARILDPKQFDSFAVQKISNGINLVLGIKDGKSTAQSYRFKKSIYTVEEARKWIKEHNIKTILFEEASKTQAFKKRVHIASYAIQSFAQSKIMEMIDPATLEKIKEKDPHPFFQAYSLCHEGVSSPKRLGEKRRPITWLKDAIQSLKNVTTKGVKFFSGHNKDNSTNNRRILGEIVADTQEEMDGKLHHIIVGYFPKETREEVKEYDVNSQEGIWNFFEKAGNLFASNIEKLTGVALSKSSIDEPAFSGAKKLGYIQAFSDEKKKTGDGKMTYEEIKPYLTFDVLKRAKQDLNVFPWQLFAEEEIKKDREFGKLFDSLDSQKKDIEKYTKEIEDLKNEKNGLLRKTQLVDAKERLSSLSKEMNLTDKQMKFINNRFKDDIEDLSNDGLKKYLDSELNTFKEIASYFDEDKGVQTENKDSDRTDMTIPDNNPLLEKEE